MRAAQVFRIARILGGVVGGLMLLATVLVLSSPVVYYGVRRRLCGDEAPSTPPGHAHPDRRDSRDSIEIFHDAPAVGDAYTSGSETEDEQAGLVDKWGRSARRHGDGRPPIRAASERHHHGGVELGKMSNKV
eukprot:2603131-Pyramimonas_sp.AAC.1